MALHGIQSHSGWYTFSSGRLCAAGFEVYFLDRRGSGMNQSARGHVVHCERLINDVTQLLGDIRAGYSQPDPPRPIILLGISWGGKLATVIAAQRPDLIDGLALLYPGLRARLQTRWDQNVKLSLAGRLGILEKQVRIPLDDPALFTGEPHWQNFIRNDPLALRDLTVSFLLANRGLDRLLPVCPPAIRSPVLLMLAGKDQIIDNEATKRYVSQFATRNSSVYTYPESRHTLEFEPDRETFVDDLTSWSNRIASPSVQ